MTRIHVCLSWYREDPVWLVEMVESVAPFAASVTAIDGPYPLLEYEQDTSTLAEYAAIRDTCHAHGMDAHFLAPGPLSEVEKRTVMFREAARQAANTDDWLLVMDSDELVTGVDVDGLRQALGESPYLAAECTYRHRPNTRGDEPFRKLFRALPGIYLEGTHFVYAVHYRGDTHYLWHSSRGVYRRQPVPATDVCSLLTVSHRPEPKTARREQQRTYYRARERVGIESVGRVRRKAPPTLKPLTEFGVKPMAGDKVRIRMLVIPAGEYPGRESGQEYDVSQAEALRLLNLRHAEAVAVVPSQRAERRPRGRVAKAEKRG